MGAFFWAVLTMDFFAQDLSKMLTHLLTIQMFGTFEVNCMYNAMQI